MTVTANGRKIFCTRCGARCLIEATQTAGYCHRHRYLASSTAAFTRQQVGAGPALAALAEYPTDAELAEHDKQLNCLSTSAQAVANRLMQESWSGTFGELMEQARAECGPAAAWLRDHPRTGSTPTPPHPRTPEAARGPEVARWRDACYAIGPDALTLGAQSDEAESDLTTDADTLARGWREAQEQSKLHGRPIFPAAGYRVVLTSGLLAELAEAARKYATAHPDRTRIGDLAGELDRAVANWTELEDRREEVDNDDPHKKTQDWASEHGLPRLSGSEKQVRWAEKIRYEMCAGNDELTSEIAAVEGDCGVWIGLSKAPADDLVAAWGDMRSRPRHRWGD